MNDNVTIKEGGLTRRLAPIDKLKVNTTDNKESMWVSADKSKTGVLHASENGIYIASEDGYEAYSEVIVRVTKDSFEGDTDFDDWDYETPDMDLSNWDPETIEEFENDPEAFDEVFNDEDEWKDIDKPIDIKMDNPKIQDTKISGIDPVTGNEMEVGLDEDGYLTESTIPSSIKIEVPPDKHQYVDGQPILFRGMVVKAYTADGELWTDTSHPDSVIPHSELTFPVTTAHVESQNEKTATSDLIDGKISFNAPPLKWNTGGYNPPQKEISGGTAAFCAYTDNNTLYKALASGTPYKYRYIENRIEGDYVVLEGDPNTYTYNGKTVYYNSGYESPGDYGYSAPINGILPVKEAAWTVIYGTIKSGGEQTVPVQYIRSDGEVLEDSFTIEVLPDPDGAHPQVDPNTVEWNHRRYKANEELGAVEVRHGSVYMEGGAIYDVGAAVRLGMLEPVDNEIVS